MSSYVTETDTEQAAFELVWKALEPLISQARTMQVRLVSDPPVHQNDRSKTLVSWLERYPKEIVAIQTLHDAVADPRFHVPLHSLSVGRQAANRLLADLSGQLVDDAPGNDSADA
jgi:hypothetical protein